MEYYNDQLMQLKEQMARKEKLTAQLKILRAQREKLQDRIRDLEADLTLEQADVERVEGKNLANFFYSVIGRRDGMLSKEKEEAYDVKIRLDAAIDELEALKADIRSLEQENGELFGCERKYEKLLEEMKAAIKSNDQPKEPELLRMEEELAALKVNEKEIKEALSAGNSALHTAESIISSLSSAAKWGTWDLLGGGLIADIGKHSHLDDAQANMERLRLQLRQFKAELADISIYADTSVNVDGFLKFADYFFDGIFADFTVMSRIENSRSNMEKTVLELKSAIRRIEELQSENARKQTALENRILKVRSKTDA